jgi:hypothetical protein
LFCVTALILSIVRQIFNIYKYWVFCHFILYYERAWLENSAKRDVAKIRVFAASGCPAGMA